MIDTYVSLARLSPASHVEQVGEAWLCRSSIRHPIGNLAIGLNGTGIPERVVNVVMSQPYFRLYSLPGDDPAEFAEAAFKAGLRERYELTGMVLHAAGTAEIELNEAVDLAEAQRVAGFIADTFFWRTPKRSREALARIMASAHPKHRFFWLEDETGTTAAGTLTLDAEVTGLYNLCVRRDVRSRGLGSSVAAELSRKAASRSGHVALLCDTELVPWYSRHGYRIVGSLRAFSA